MIALGVHHVLRETLHGVDDVTVDARDSFVTVDFDRTTTGLAEIVRVLEEQGLVVQSVAERPGIWSAP